MKLNRNKKIIFTVTSDPFYDQRMQRICTSLANAGYDVTLVGRKLKHSEKTDHLPFKVRRFRMIFKKGKFFYAAINTRLFFYLLFKRFDAVCAIDLDTILPVKQITGWKNKKFIYDSHELFTEMHEVTERPKIKRMWTRFEKRCVPKTDLAYTVCQSIADIYSDKYKVQFHVIRNMDIERPTPNNERERTLIYVGTVNPGRGVEELIEAMKDISARLKICGYGDILEEMKEKVKKEGLEDKIEFTGNLSPDQLREELAKASIGVILLSNLGKSYYYSLANKFFDYLQAELPQITIDFPEYRRIMDEFEIGTLVKLDVPEIVTAANELLSNEEKYKQLKSNCIDAKKVLNWDNESQKLVSLYDNLFSQNG